ncbi:MAG: transcriptional regulator, partial [Ralstonia sp.]|nr:transcriptional regulator [Ralstonia sp.]
ERAQAALEAELAAQTIAGILSEVGHAQRRRRRA